MIKQSAFSFSVRFPQHDRRRLLAAKMQGTVRLRYAWSPTHERTLLKVNSRRARPTGFFAAKTQSSTPLEKDGGSGESRQVKTLHEDAQSIRFARGSAEDTAMLRNGRIGSTVSDWCTPCLDSDKYDKSKRSIE